MQLVMLVILGVWIYRYARSLTLNRSSPFSSQGPQKPAQKQPLVSVMLAARNEQDNIERCLASLSSQIYENYEIIVADDRSDDETGRIVRERFPHVRYVGVSSLPAGYAGKSHALFIAEKHAHGDWYLFTDADTVHSERSIMTPLRHALEHRLDMLSLLPRPLLLSFWEKVVQPVIGLLLFLLFPLERVNRPGDKTFFGCGQYILISRQAYRAIGGHERLLSNPLEDIIMARNAKRANLNYRLLYGGDIFRTRMYDSLRAIRHGWERIYFLIFSDRIWVLPLVLLLIFALSLFPFIGLFLFPGLALAQLLFMFLSLERAYRHIGSARIYILTHPLGCLITMGILWSAFWKKILKRGVTWRGHRYHELCGD